MNTISDGGPAFPFTPTDCSGQIGPNYEGMALRDWFAGMALSGMMSYCNHHRGDFHTNCDDETIGKTAYAYADAMLAARKEQS